MSSSIGRTQCTFPTGEATPSGTSGPRAAGIKVNRGGVPGCPVGQQRLGTTHLSGSAPSSLCHIRARSDRDGRSEGPDAVARRTASAATASRAVATHSAAECIPTDTDSPQPPSGRRLSWLWIAAAGVVVTARVFYGFHRQAQDEDRARDELAAHQATSNRSARRAKQLRGGSRRWRRRPSRIAS